MSDSQPVIWLTGYQNRALTDIVNLAHRYRADSIVDVCDISDAPESNLGWYQDLRNLLRSISVTFHVAGYQLGVFPYASDHCAHIGLELHMRGFAEHMRTELFKQGIRKVISLARDSRTIVINGNNDFEDSSRMLIADYLFLMEGFRVFHILPDEKICEHRPTHSARVEAEGIIYDRAESKCLLYH